MKKEVIAELGQIAGAQNVTQEKEQLAAYFRDALPLVPLAAVCPEDAEQVSELVRWAAREAVPLFTLKDRSFSVPLPESGGVIVDFKRLDAIDRVDKRNLTAHIQRGVTWEQLGRELKRQGVKTLMPASATSPYVLESMMCRTINREAARYPEVQISNMRVVLADGRVHLTGSHALDEHGCDSKDDGAQNLSRWYIGAEDIFGIPVRASIWIYPQPAVEQYLFFGFDELAPALAALRNIPRKEVCDQALVMNNHYLGSLCGESLQECPPWLLLLGCEGQSRHVEFQVGVCRQDALALGGRELGDLEQALSVPLDSVWYRPEHSHGFYTFVPRAAEFHEIVSSQAEGALGELFVSHGYGRAAWCEFDYLEPGTRGLKEKYEGISDLLLEKGAYFDRPLGRLAERFYAGNAGYLNQIKRVKSMLDPKGILNPDQLVIGV